MRFISTPCAFSSVTGAVVVLKRRRKTYERHDCGIRFRRGAALQRSVMWICLDDDFAAAARARLGSISVRSRQESIVPDVVSLFWSERFSGARYRHQCRYRPDAAANVRNCEFRGELTSTCRGHPYFERPGGAFAVMSKSYNRRVPA
jgi:hypothetical protein